MWLDGEDSLYPKNKESLSNRPYLLPAHRAELLNEALANFAELPPLTHPTLCTLRGKPLL